MNFQINAIWYLHQRAGLIFSFILIGLLLAVSGFTRLNPNVDFSDYFAKQDPRFMTLQQMHTRFTRNDELWLLLEKKGSWQDASAKQQLMAFVSKLTQSKSVESVSGYNQFIAGEVGTEHLLEYKTHPRLDSVLSLDNKAVLLAIKLSDSELVNYANKSEWLLSSLAQLEKTTQDYWAPFHVSGYFSGTQALNWQYAKVLRHDLSWFAPGLLLIIFMMAAIFIREKHWLVGIIVNCVVTLILTIGVAAWFKLTLAAISAFIPVIIVTLTLAYASHLYLGWKEELNLGLSADEALANSVKSNQPPLFYASLTTMLGFSLLYFSPSPPIQSFGLLVAFAVSVNYLMSLSALLWFAKRVKNIKPQPAWQLPTIINVAKWSVKRPKRILIALFIMTLASGVSVTKLQINDDPLSYFPKDNPFNLASQKMQQYFFGINLQHFVVSVPETESKMDKQYVHFLYQFSRFLKQQPEVIKVQHLGDWIKSAGLGLTQFQRWISDADLHGLRLDGEVSEDGRASLVTFYLQPLTARELIAFEVKVSTWLAQHKQGVELSPALGSNILFAHLSLDNANNMLQSFAIALLVLVLLLGFLKRSWRYSAVGLLLNFLPLLWVFGLWQITGGFISLGSAVVLGMMLGIIVDDTLHLMLKLPHKTVFAQKPTTLWSSYRRVIPVVTFTTLTLFLGFSIGLVSDFAPIAQLSLLSCLVVIIAWLFDVLLLPVLYCHWLGKTKRSDL